MHLNFLANVLMFTYSGDLNTGSSLLRLMFFVESQLAKRLRRDVCMQFEKVGHGLMWEAFWSEGEWFVS